MSHSFLKIVHFEDYRQFCRYREDGVCKNPDATIPICARPDRATMNRCSVWTKFQDFNVRRKEDGRDAKEGQKRFHDQDSWEESEVSSH